MATNVLGYKKALTWGGTAGVALTQYTAVAINFETGVVSYPASTGDYVDGIVLNNAGVGEQVEVVILGLVPVKVKTAANVLKGDLLMSSAQGEMVEATSTNVAIAICKSEPDADEDIITVQLIAPTVVA